jgi:hypothetical protein
VAGRIGIGVLFGSIIVSTALDRTSENVLIEGVSQGILVLGWVALWRPAAHFVGRSGASPVQPPPLCRVRRHRRPHRLDELSVSLVTEPGSCPAPSRLGESGRASLGESGR